jgi:hypothetical protein
MDSPKPKLQHYGWGVGGGINCPCMATRKNLPSFKKIKTLLWSEFAPNLDNKVSGTGEIRVAQFISSHF